jgi:hypothetical protein
MQQSFKHIKIVTSQFQAGCDVTSNMDKNGSVQGEANYQNTAAKLKQTRTRECGLSRTHCMVGAFIFSVKTAIFIGVLLIIKSDNPRETPQPSFAPTIDRVKFLLPSLIGEASSSGIDFASAVQQEAWNWLAWDDPAELSVYSDPNHVVNKYRLVLFYYAIGGPEWHVKRIVYVAGNGRNAWLSGLPVCRWGGIAATMTSRSRLFGYVNLPKKNTASIPEDYHTTSHRNHSRKPLKLIKYQNCTGRNPPVPPPSQCPQPTYRYLYSKLPGLL